MRYEVVIMGAGSTGSSIAYNLVKKGITNIIIIDKNCAGCGQTSRSSALIRLHYTNDDIREMAVFSWKFWRKFQDETGCEYPVFTKTGIAFAGPEEYLDSMENVIRSLKNMGVDADLYDPYRFREEVFKYININGLAAIAWEPESGYGDPNTSVRCFLKYAERAGAEISEYNRIKRIISEDSIITAIETDKGIIRGEYFVNALGVWANEVLSSIKIKLPLKYVREDVLYIKNPGNKDLVPPGWEDLALGFYSRPEGESYSLIGSLEGEYVDRYYEAGEYSSPPLEIVNKRSKPYTERFPEMVKASPYAAIYGFYDVTPDWQPIIGFDNKINNLIHMVGLSGHGFKLSPAYGDIISDIIKYGDSRRFNVKGFSVNRFEKGESRHSDYKYGIVG